MGTQTATNPWFFIVDGQRRQNVHSKCALPAGAVVALTRRGELFRSAMSSRFFTDVVGSRGSRNLRVKLLVCFNW